VTQKTNRILKRPFFIISSQYYDEYSYFQNEN
jgi:hypothetical protein